MYDLHFGRDRPPFRDESERNPHDDPVVMSIVRRATQRGVTSANLPRWLKQNQEYLRRNYDFATAIAAGYTLDYIWVVVLAYLLACERADEGNDAFFAPHLPFALVEPSGRLDEESALILYIATFSHALLYPMDFAKRRASAVSMQTDALMVAAITTLASRHPVREYALPTILDLTPSLREMTLEAVTPTRRWFANVAHMSTVLVAENATPAALRLHRPGNDRKKRKKK